MTEDSNSGELHKLRSEVGHLRHEVQELNDNTKALLEAWTTATGVVKFMKVLSSFAAAIAAVYFFATHGFSKPIP